MDGFGERRVNCRGGRGRIIGSWGEDVWRKEMQQEGEVRGRKDGEGFDENIGCGFVAG